MCVRLLIPAVLVGACLGCGAQPSGDSTAQPPADIPATEPATTDDAPAAGQPAAEIERVAATVGVGKKGRSLDDETGVGGVIAQPARSYFAVKERVVFEVQIPQALQLFRASEGRAPKSHEEFMQKIIEFNKIPLPELPEGQSYEYDPQTSQLMVKRPKVGP